MLNFVQQLQEQSLRDLIDQNIYLELKEIMKNLINYLQINQSKLQNSSKKNY